MDPLKQPLRFLRFFCRQEYLEEIEGDLLERYEERSAQNKPAGWLLWIDVIKLIRPRMIKSISGPRKKHSFMLIHNMKVSLRNFRRHRVSFLINYLGLLGGLVTVLFIYLWTSHEMSVDKFHQDNDRIYRLVNGGNNTFLNTSSRFADELEASIPEIEYVVNSAWGQLESNLVVENQVFNATGEFGSHKFFELFTYPLTIGNKHTVLNEPNAIVLSQSTALKLFNSEDVVGKRLVWRWYSMEEPVVVTGVYKDPPKTSSAQFDYVLTFEIFKRRFKQRIARGNRNSRTYLKIAQDAKAEVINEKIRQHTRTNYPEFDGQPYFITRYDEYYLRGDYENNQLVGGRIELVRLFVMIGVLILIIACVNFMNLSTARASLRTKEIGVRKTMGALRKSLVFQYLQESCTISAFAGITAICLLFLLLPFFQNLVGQAIEIPFSFEFVLSFLAIILLTGILAGSYPALYLSGFNPLKVLNGQFTASSGDQWFRKGLVVFQFGVSLVLIVAVLVILQQMNFVQTKGLGYNRERILNFISTGMNGEKQQTFLSQVRKLNGVEKASGISHALFGGQKSGANITWEGKNPEDQVWFEWGYVDYDMIELLDIDLLEGRAFSRNFGDENSKVIINQATKDLIGSDSAVGKKFSVDDNEYEIIGVTHDFHFQSLHEQIQPTFFLLKRWSMKMALKIRPHRMKETIHEIEKIYSRFNPGFPFQYSFHDQDIGKLYTTEDKIVLLTKYAAALAIMISSLGLLGLVSFITERKAKEMGIRKVLGASSISIVRAISKDFVLPITLASIIGVVISASLIDRWLDGFAYRINLQWWFFAIAILLMVSIAALTSLSQILKVVNTNPIKSLRDE